MSDAAYVCYADGRQADRPRLLQECNRLTSFHNQLDVTCALDDHNCAMESMSSAEQAINDSPPEIMQRKAPVYNESLIQ